MTARSATVLMVLFISGTLLMCLFFSAIFVMPEIPLNPYPPSHATARADATLAAMAPQFQSPDLAEPTATSIYGPTWTPTHTPLPSDTPTPTTTRTPTPTSSPTNTSTPFPTKTSTVTPTSTPLPPPTATLPPPYRVGRVLREPNCDVVRVKGHVNNAQGLPIAGVRLQVGEVGVANSLFETAPTDANGFYVWDFGAPNDNVHTWFVVPLENGQLGAEERYEFKTDVGDHCDATEAVQIVTVDWTRRPDIVIQSQ